MPNRWNPFAATTPKWSGPSGERSAYAAAIRRRAADVLDERDRLVVAGRSTLSALRWLLCLQSAVESSVPGYS
jgi:hypothetical protein